MGDLHPIIIYSLEHTSKSVKFTCSGEGLYKNGYLYGSHAEKLIPPKNTKASAVSKQVEEKKTGAIADLQLRLREAKKTILPEIKSVETELNKEFKKSIAARNDSRASNTVEQKAKMNPKKYLNEAFPKGGFADAAEAMGLDSVSVDTPWTANRKPYPDRWVVIGRTRDAVWNQMRDIEREVGRSKQTFSAEKKKPLSTSNPAITTKKEAKSTPKRVEKTFSSSLKKEVKTIAISKSKPEIKTPTSKKAIPTMRSPLQIGPTLRPEEFGQYRQPERVHFQIMIIRIERRGRHWPQNVPPANLCIAFDFSAIEGFMRFERPIPNSKSDTGSESSKKRKREDVEEDRDMKLNRYPQFARDDAGDYSEAGFHLGPDDKPTAQRPTWWYRWRGHETGEGEFQVNADKVALLITFSQNGNALFGYFKCDYVNECYFEGVKVRSKPRDQHRDPEAQWMNHSETAHEYARPFEMGRWRIRRMVI
ncbi:hypothetical protein DL98DRAFT_655604 [Cadophora sp. DSE1049]|nr:hypothetical protein DL98DRAFT_655604 [Cadophora sp. DSE1049]